MPKTPLLPLAQRYFESDPARAAHALETMEEGEALEVLKAMPHALSTQAVQHLQENLAAALLQKLPDALFRGIVERLDAQKSAALFLHLSSEVRARFLENLSEKKKKEIQEILTYPEGSAGRIMSTDFLAFHGDVKVKEVIQKIRQLAQRGAASSYVYVIDPAHKLIGVMNMRDMLLAQPDASLESVMRQEVFTVNCFDDRETVAGELSRLRYFAAPVVDHERRLLGVVKAEQLLEDVQEEATEDMQKMFGAGGDEKAFSPVFFSIRKRLPWLYVNLFTAFVAAFVVALFEDIIAKITVLAVYLPVVAGQGGNAGAQSLAVVMRGLVMREIPPAKVRKMMVKETWIGIVNGILIGAVTAAIAWRWQGNPFLGLVVGLGMFANLVIAGFSGALIPLGMKALGLDPAQCSNIILTTITDVMGFLVFLGLAVAFQAYLI